MKSRMSLRLRNSYSIDRCKDVLHHTGVLDAVAGLLIYAPVLRPQRCCEGQTRGRHPGSDAGIVSKSSLRVQMHKGMPL
jgi:hypothetical protein